jgi:hypothetical protein
MTASINDASMHSTPRSPQPDYQLAQITLKFADDDGGGVDLIDLLEALNANTHQLQWGIAHLKAIWDEPNSFFRSLEEASEHNTAGRWLDFPLLMQLSRHLLLLRQGRIVALSPGVEPEQVSDANAMVQHAVIVIETGDDWVWRVAMADRGALARLEHQFEKFLWLPS